MFIAIVTGLILSAANTAQASEVIFSGVVNSKAGFFDIKEVEIKKISEEELDVDVNSALKGNNSLLNWNDCSQKEKTVVNTVNDNKTVTNRNARNRKATDDEESEGTDSKSGKKTDKDKTVVEETIDGVKDVIETSKKDKNTIVFDQIVNTGKELWKFIEKNKPLVSAKTQTANALPAGLTCWTQLENWSAPRVLTISAVYKNPYGFKVVDMQYKLIYTPGGQVNGVGRYISNATIQYKKLNVLWGYNVSADVEIPQVVNLGTTNSPVAGMQMTVNWNIKTAVKHIQQTDSYFVYADGRPVEAL